MPAPMTRGDWNLLIEATNNFSSLHGLTPITYLTGTAALNNSLVVTLRLDW